LSTPHKVLFWDVESAPMLGWLWQAKTDWVASGMLEHEVFLLSWAAKWEGSRSVISDRLTGEEAVAQDDSRIVTSLIDLIREADTIVAHNGDRFDAKVVRGRAMLLGVEPLGPVRSIDTLAEAKRSFRLSHNSLAHLARHLEVPTKLGTSFALWRDSYGGDETALAKMDRYCRRDVRVLEDVYRKMRPYVKGAHRLQSAETEGEHVCPSCGSAELVRRGTYETNASTFQRYRCECGRWSRSRKSSPVRLSTTPLA